MLVIPVINCANFNCVQEKMKKSADLSATWVHIDIEDGQFLAQTTWNNPDDLISNFPYLPTGRQFPIANLEVHLMVENPEEILEKWISAGAKRIFVHSESLKNINNFLDIVKKFRQIEFGIAIKPGTSAKELLLYSKFLNFFQVLAVSPGSSGQIFNPSVLEKIRFLRTSIPNAKIEVDGGINKETAKLAKMNGADIVASSSYIWDSDDPKKAYEELLRI